MDFSVRTRRFERNEPPRCNEPILDSLISITVLAPWQRQDWNRGHRKEQKRYACGKHHFHLRTFKFEKRPMARPSYFLKYRTVSFGAFPILPILGITKRIGWHTFRHTYSTLLRSTGAGLKIMQKLLRHSTIRVTLDTYTQAVTTEKAQCAGGRGRAFSQEKRKKSELCLGDLSSVRVLSCARDGAYSVSV